MSQNTAIATSNTVQSTVTHKPDFGNGRYSAMMKEIWHDAQSVFKLTSEQAEKLARQISSDWGAVMKDRPVKVKTSSINDDGKMTLSEAAIKVKGVQHTDALYALRALQYAGEAGKAGFSISFTVWKPVQQLEEYLRSL